MLATDRGARIAGYLELDGSTRSAAYGARGSASDHWLPQWRDMVGGLGECKRDGWPVGWLDPATPAVGALLADFAD